MADVSVVVLTMGDRVRALESAVASARNQPVSVEIVLVINGGSPDRSLADVIVEPDKNLGIPEGRNAGAAAASSAVLCFLDDDGLLLDNVFGPAIDAFDADSHLAVIGLRVVDETGATARRHVPGLLRKHADRSGPATAFPGGACIVRRAAFEAVGGLCGPFRYSLEETDLAWRFLDAAWSVAYRADLRMQHPRTNPNRHPDFVFRTARNRVWLAYRNLPYVLGVCYVLNWSIVTIVRSVLKPSDGIAHLRGTAAGLRGLIGPRQPMTWQTVIALTRRGRPPLI